MCECSGCMFVKPALVEDQMGSVTLLFFTSRPGQCLRESTRRGTQKALLSGRLVCAVPSTRVLNLRRFLRMAIGMGLSLTRCTGCCHQEPSLVGVLLPSQA